MGFPLAFLLFIAGVACLFYLDRDEADRNSNALWLPVIWLWIVGSRPVSAWLAIWFGIGQSGGRGLDAQLDGSPTDAFIAMGLLAAATAVLLGRRQRRTVLVLKSSTPLLVYFFYCLLSCLWSPFPDVAFKRWTKDVGDLAMVLLIVTDPHPIEALRRLFSRVGLILLPASVLLIRYSTLGQAFGIDGSPTYTGVTTNKNELGLITFVISVGAFWNCVNVLRANRSRKRSRQLLARVTLVAFGVLVLQQAHSATSIACFMIGATLILTTNLSFFRRHPQRVQALVLTIIVAGAVGLLFGGKATVASALGRDGDTLGDRTLIWEAVIPVCPNPIVGAGFESFWNGYGKYVKGRLSIYERGLNSAHNGYIEVWLNLGWIGVGLIAILLVTGFRRACDAFRRNPEVGSLMLAYIASVSMYSITEAGYRIMTPTLFAFFLVLVGSRNIGSSAKALPKQKPTFQGWAYQPDQTPVSLT